MYNRRIAGLTKTCGWAKLWAHWGSHGVLTTNLPRNDLDIPFVRVGEEGVYVRNVGKILDWLGENLREDLVHVEFWVFRYPYDDLWFFEAH